MREGKADQHQTPTETEHDGRIVLSLQMNNWALTPGSVNPAAVLSSALV